MEAFESIRAEREKVKFKNQEESKTAAPKEATTTGDGTEFFSMIQNDQNVEI
tara:strand:+ start:2128 stop:2283 length:156 start_codon:yes stop_codon:yes gene_type:complete